MALGERDRGERDRGERDRGERDRGERDRGERERGERDRGERDRGERDREQGEGKGAYEIGRRGKRGNNLDRSSLEERSGSGVKLSNPLTFFRLL